MLLSYLSSYWVARSDVIRSENKFAGFSTSKSLFHSTELELHLTKAYITIRITPVRLILPPIYALV